jgi:hypothetical protein
MEFLLRMPLHSPTIFVGLTGRDNAADARCMRSVVGTRVSAKLTAAADFDEKNVL